MIKNIIKKWKEKHRMNKYGEQFYYEAKANDGVTYKAFKKNDLYMLYKEFRHHAYYLGSVKDKNKAIELCETFKTEWDEYNME